MADSKEGVPEKLFTKNERRQLRKTERERIREAQRRREHRMRLARRGVIGLGVATVLALIGREALRIRPSGQRDTRVLSPDPGGVDITVKEREYAARKDVVDLLIPRFEEGMRRLRLLVDPMIAQFEDPTLRDIYRRSFDVVEVNRRNTVRNRNVFYFEDLQRMKQQGKTKAGVSKVEIADRAYFFYDIMLPSMREYNAQAAFEGASRTIFMSAQFDQHNLFDLVVGFHEAGHAAQDTLARQEKYGVPYQAFLQLYGNKGMVLDFELEMYAAELSLVNLITDGRFADDCLADKFPTTRYITEWNMRAEQAEPLEFLAYIGKSYFSSESTPLVFAAPFVRTVKEQIRATGLIPHRLVRGTLVRDSG